MKDAMPLTTPHPRLDLRWAPAERDQLIRPRGGVLTAAQPNRPRRAIGINRHNACEGRRFGQTHVSDGASTKTHVSDGAFRSFLALRRMDGPNARKRRDPAPRSCVLAIRSRLPCVLAIRRRGLRAVAAAGRVAGGSRAGCGVGQGGGGMPRRMTRNRPPIYPSERLYTEMAHARNTRVTDLPQTRHRPATELQLSLHTAQERGSPQPKVARFAARQ